MSLPATSVSLLFGVQRFGTSDRYPEFPLDLAGLGVQDCQRPDTTAVNTSLDLLANKFPILVSGNSLRLITGLATVNCIGFKIVSVHT